MMREALEGVLDDERRAWFAARIGEDARERIEDVVALVGEALGPSTDAPWCRAVAWLLEDESEKPERLAHEVESLADLATRFAATPGS